tara:strand:+ start:144 stop:842 length:699 start_codon:yes stop_codon:yes gene_type:complete
MFQKKIEIVDEDTLKYDDSLYKLDEIESLGVENIQENYRVNVFVKAGSAKYANLYLKLKNIPKVIKVTSINTAENFLPIPLMFTGGGQQSEKILDLYSYIQKKTFEQRVNRYYDDWKKLGYFRFDTAIFYDHKHQRGGLVEFTKTKSKIALWDNEYEKSIDFGFFYMEKKRTGFNKFFAQQITDVVKRPYHHCSLLMDRDCFLHLMDECYSVSFSVRKYDRGNNKLIAKDHK